MDKTRTMQEFDINSADPDPEGSVFFLVQKKETLTRHYIVKGTASQPIKTAKAVREDYENHGHDSWIEKDGWVDWNGERITKIEKVVYSPCSLANTSMTPPADWTEESHPSIRYLSRSTMFDVQPERGVNRIWRRYKSCNNYIHGKTKSICSCCMSRIRAGWSVITPLKTEDSD